MRIKALSLSDSPLMSMANGGAEKVGTLPKNEFITIIDIKRDGGNTFYKLEEYDGFIKKDYVKLLRDEEFYYSSSLLRSKTNRSRSAPLLMMRAIASDGMENVKDLGTGISDHNKIQPGDSITVINAKIDAQRKELGLPEIVSFAGKFIDTSQVDGLIAPFDPAQTKAIANASNKNNILGSSITSDSLIKSFAPRGNKGPADQTGTQTNQEQQQADPNAKKLGMTGIEVSQTIANIGSNFLARNTSLGNSRAGNIALNAIGNFGATGSWDNTNAMNIGGFFEGDAGEILNGLSIDSINDGSFFSKTLAKNTSKVVASYLNTLLTKLDYVVGFNLSATALNILSGFGVIGNSGTFKEITKIYRPTFAFNNIANLDDRIRRYFTYRGTSYGMTWKWGGNVRMDYSTPTMTSKKDPDQVRVHKELYENLYSEFQSSLDVLKDTLNLNMSEKDWFVNFNRFRLAHPDHMLGNSKGYIFFTRPDLNIGAELATNSDIGLLVHNIMSQKSMIATELMKKMPDGGDHQFMPLLSNRCQGIDIADETLETKELGETLTGWRLNYGMNLIKSQSSNTVTTSFIDDDKLSIYLLFKLWCEYISAVSRGQSKPKREYIRTKQLDYANSIYYFLTAQDGESIIYWTKFTGCIPTNIPSSNFSDSIDSPIKLPKYSITWQYAFKKDYDPYTLAEFNNLTGNGFNYNRIYSKETARSSPSLSGAPFVDTRNGGATFKLRFRKKS